MLVPCNEVEMEQVNDGGERNKLKVSKLDLYLGAIFRLRGDSYNTTTASAL